MKEREALKQALEALEIEQAALAYEHGKVEHIENAITAIKEALAQPEQEPKCNPHPKAPHGFNRNASHANDRYTCECESWDAYDAGYQAGVMAGIEASMGQEPEQEPVAWANRVIGGRKWLSIHASKGASDRWLEYRIKEQAQGEEYERVALYTNPPQRPSRSDIKPLFKEFIKWAGAQGYDCGMTCNSDTGEWIVLNPMTADLWKAWQAAHGIKE